MTTKQANPNGLNGREAVIDALHRCLFGIDSNDRDLFESSWLKDESTIVVAGPMTIEGWTAINGFFARLFDLVTSHVISNTRVELTDGDHHGGDDGGAAAAYVTAHGLAYHVRPKEALTPEDTSYTASNLYFVDLVRDKVDGLWKIKRWEIRVLWTTGDRAVIYG